MATIKFEDKKGQVQVKKIPGFGFIDCTDDDDDCEVEMRTENDRAGSAQKTHDVQASLIQHPSERSHPVLERCKP